MIENQNMEIVNKLVEKSQEAFIVGIELYNKPTIKYRVEGFSFFICNAWELLLKAYMIKNSGIASIYYQDSGQTKSLAVCVKSVYTNNKDPLRQNLEKIIELRNTSTHFITEEYEQIYVPLFQSCVVNYISKLLNYFDVDITEQLGSNFLTLSVKMNDLSESAVLARYPKEIATKIIDAMAMIGQTINTVDNEKYAIPVRHDYYITKNKKEATASFCIAKDADQAAFIVKEWHDMKEACPHQEKDCIRIINKRIRKDIPYFINPTPNEADRHKFNTYTFRLFVKFYNIKQDPKYCYTYKTGSTTMYSYSDKAIDFIVERIKKDPEHIIQGLKDKIGKPTPGAKEF